MSVYTFVMNSYRETGLHLSKLNCSPKAPEHAEICRLKPEMINVIIYLPLAFRQALAEGFSFNKAYKDIVFCAVLTNSFLEN